MKVGDLITKTKGYGSLEGWVGIVLGHRKPTPKDGVRKGGQKVIVLTQDGIETWIERFCEVINELN